MPAPQLLRGFEFSRLIFPADVIDLPGVADPRNVDINLDRRGLVVEKRRHSKKPRHHEAAATEACRENATRLSDPTWLAEVIADAPEEGLRADRALLVLQISPQKIHVVIQEDLVKSRLGKRVASSCRSVS